MGKKQSGNGSGKFDIHTENMGGWVRVFTDPQAQVPEDLPVYLSLVLTNWFRQHSHLRLRTVLPVSREGRTVELHAWYDQLLFPEPPPNPPPPAK